MKEQWLGNQRCRLFFSSQLLLAIEDVGVVQMLLFDNVSQTLPLSAHTKQKVKSRATFWF